MRGLILRVFIIVAVFVLTTCELDDVEKVREQMQTAFTVTFNGNNGSGTAPAAMTVNSGSSITIPGAGNLTRSGHTFGGWNTNAAGTGINYAAGFSYTVTSDVTFYARWIPTFTVTFNANNASSGTAPAAQTVNSGSGITLPNENSLTRTGFTFGGWNTNAAGTGNNYAAGSFFTVTGNVTLYARWIPAGTPTFTVTFNANNATGGSAPAAQTASSGSSITLPGAGNLARSGHTFGGWNTNATGTGMNYATGSSYTVTGNVTLFARWIPIGVVEMVHVPGGSFELGRNLGTGGGNDWTPVSMVTLSGFYMGKYTVTQEQYQAVMGHNPSWFHGGSGREPAVGEVQGRRPVERVGWYNAIVFSNRLSLNEGLTPAYRINGSTNPDDWGVSPEGNNTTWNAVEIVPGSTGYRLPTEAQWEYAAKGGNVSPGNFSYSGSNNPDEVAWHGGNSNQMTHEVGLKQPNGLGLYDMSGNVREWIWDWRNNYTSEAKMDPLGPPSSSPSLGSPARVIRGCDWDWGYWPFEDIPGPDLYPSLANRDWGVPWSQGTSFTGFRLARP